MPTTRSLSTTPSTTTAHAAHWTEIALLIGYIVICLLSVLTVLLPTTENEEEHAKPKASPSTASAGPTK
jgi:hypothetical protein